MMHVVRYPRLWGSSMVVKATVHEACLGSHVLLEHGPAFQTENKFVGKIACVGLRNDSSEVAW